MAEKSSGVYDIIHPTPASLQELSAIAIVLKLWQREVDKYRRDGILEKFQTKMSLSSSLETLRSDLPSVIFHIIEQIVPRFSYSVGQWLLGHQYVVFLDNYNCTKVTHALEYFDDLVCDYNGTIHYVRTAERIIHSDRLSNAVKFYTACLYCFEDDIRRIWPLVSSKIHARESFYFSRSPQLCYWLCCLRNKRGTEISWWSNDPVDEIMFDCVFPNRSSVEYFWNRIREENRIPKAAYLCKRNAESFVRFILPKLDDRELDKFVNEYSINLMKAMFKQHSYHSHQVDSEFILKTWKHIRNFMKECTFTNLVVKMLMTESTGTEKNFLEDCSMNLLYLFREIWSNTPHNLKQSTIKDILSSGELFEYMGARHPPIANTRNVGFLLTTLQYASLTQRRSFWQNNLLDLIADTRGNDLQRIMKVCFEHEDEITQFKENILLIDESVLRMCVSLLRDGNFTRLNEFVRFLCPEIQSARNFKRELLRIAFLSRGGEFNPQIAQKNKQLNEFIDDAFTNDDLSADFKNQFLSSVIIQKYIFLYIHPRYRICLKHTMEFIESLASTKQILSLIKTRIIDYLREKLVANNSRFYRDIFHLPFSDQFLLWCLGSDEQVETFKLDYNKEF